MDEDVDRLTFPDGPRSELDASLGRLVESAHRVLATESRLRNLLKASKSVAEDIDLATVLRTIVEAAVDLVGSKYGALGVVGPDGLLEQFIHVGMPEDLVELIGHLPEGHGVLGALIEEQGPIRLMDIAADARSSGFPPGHPPMTTFLGVPVRVRDETFGNLYVSDGERGPFSAEDEELLVALAATAGAAIDHARLYDESQRRQRWAAASAEVTAALLSDETEDSLAVLADWVARLADADVVCVALPHPGNRHRVTLARGLDSEGLVGLVFETAGTLVGRAHESGHSHLSDQGEPGDPLALGPTMVLPVKPSGSPLGALVVSRKPGRPRFEKSDLEMASDFATQASVALRLAAAREDRHALDLLEDRARIARDLHDNVIQRLFGAGLALQALAGRAEGPVRDRITEQVDALDAAIADIRTAIFTMTAQADAERPVLRHRVIDLLGELSELPTSAPRIAFSGPVDLMVSPAIADDVVAVVREGLANIARHSEAEHAWVLVAVADDAVVVEIEDDGKGVDPDVSRASGTSNLATRADDRGGSFELRQRRPNGTMLRWSVPLEVDE